MPVMRNHSGRTFGRITLSEPVSGKTGYWKGKCSCGNPVEKRIDNLKRPGVHSCGKCLAPNSTPGTDLEERVRRLERFVASVNPDLVPGPTPAALMPLTPSVVSEVREPSRSPSTPEVRGVSESSTGPRAGRFSRVTHDAEGELWEARTITGRPFFWGATEEEAAFAARVYLELTHCTVNQRIITDAELTLPVERREGIRVEVSNGL